MWSTDVLVHLIVTCSNFVPELFLERVVHQLNVLAELIVLPVCFLCIAFKIFPCHLSRRWIIMYEFVGFNIALPVAIHCFHPDCATCVKFLYASLVCYDVLYDCVNYISFYWASSMHMDKRCIYEHQPMDLSLSLSRTHAHTRKWDPLNYFFARDNF